MDFALILFFTILFRDIWEYVVHKYSHVFKSKAHLDHHRIYTAKNPSTKEYIISKFGDESLWYVYLPTLIPFVTCVLIFDHWYLWIFSAVSAFLISKFYDFLSEVAHVDRYDFKNKLAQYIRINHNYHHAKFKKNYGLPFFIWDRLFGSYENKSKK